MWFGLQDPTEGSRGLKTSRVYAGLKGDMEIIERAREREVRRDEGQWGWVLGATSVGGPRAVSVGLLLSGRRSQGQDPGGTDSCFLRLVSVGIGLVTRGSFFLF